jgi:hypothetical protein
MDADQAVSKLELTAQELSLVRTALELLLSTLSKEEADELYAVEGLLAKLKPAQAA